MALWESGFALVHFNGNSHPNALVSLRPALSAVGATPELPVRFAGFIGWMSNLLDSSSRDFALTFGQGAGEGRL